MPRLASSLSLALALLVVSGCDSGSDAALVLDGTFAGSAQSEVVAGADPTVVTLGVGIDFDAVAPGAYSAFARVETEVPGFPPDLYAGTVSGTLAADGTVSVSGTLRDGDDQTFTFSGTGDATASRITLATTGTLPVAELVLRRQ